MLFDIINDLAPVNIESVCEFLIEHILRKGKITFIRGTELFLLSIKLLTAKIQSFYQPDYLLFIAFLDDTTVFFFALYFVIYPYRSFSVHMPDKLIYICFRTHLMKSADRLLAVNRHIECIFFIINMAKDIIIIFLAHKVTLFYRSYLTYPECAVHYNIANVIHIITSQNKKRAAITGLTQKCYSLYTYYTTLFRIFQMVFLHKVQVFAGAVNALFLLNTALKQVLING